MKKLKLIAFVLAVLLLLCSCSFKGEPCEHTLTVKTEGGLPLSDVNVSVYDKKGTLIWAQYSEDDGSVAFKGYSKMTYNVVLEDVPDGYKADSSYTVTEEKTDIVLKAQLLPEDSLHSESFSLGSVFFDFSITDTEGNVHKLSELLETKKAVILNLWFINCGPCKMEFPYLNAAYGEYSDEIEVIAINPVDGSDKKVSDYREDMELDFPCATGDAAWGSCVNVSGYPTTVVIDRYGTVAMMHSGAITEEGAFEALFEYFCADDYVQTTVRDISDLTKE